MNIAKYGLAGITLLSYLRGREKFNYRTLATESATSVVFVILGIGIYFGVKYTLIYTLETVHIPVLLLHNLIAAILFGLFILMIIGNGTTGVTLFILGKELDYLFSLPIRPVKIFILKFTENIFRSSGPMFIIGMATILAYGSYFNLSMLQIIYIICLIALPYILIAAGTGIMALFLLIKIARYHEFRVLVFLALVSIIFGTGQYYKSVNPVQQIQEALQYYPDVETYLKQSDALAGNLEFLPSTFSAQALYKVVSGYKLLEINEVYFLVLMGLAILLLLTIYSRKNYHSIWLTGRETLHFTDKLRIIKPNRGLLKVQFNLGRQTDSLIKKDIWYFIRMPVQWTNFLLFIALITLYLASMSNMDLFFPDAWRMTILYLGNYIFCGFFVIALAVRFIYPVISMEGNAFWILQSAPVGLRKIFLYKLMKTSFFVYFLGLLLVIITVPSFNPGSFLVIITTILTVGFIMVTVTISLMLGTIYANFSEINPIFIASSRGATFTFITCLIYLLLSGIILSHLAHQVFAFTVKKIEYYSNYHLAITITFLAVSIMISLVNLHIGYRSFRREDLSG
ncbi:MAG: hypothetical protein KAK01_02545 [Candidatus Marinimicrobia bacterium]|nr:hypothetical protein [Candidatus Neomarinimicrobiota bacterium]